MPVDRQSFGTVRWVSFAAFVVLILSLFELLLQRSLVAQHVPLLVIQAGAVVLMLWAQVSLGWRSLRPFPDPTRAGLFTHGPYRFLRHPIYAAILLIVLVSLISNPTRPAIFLAVVISCAITIRIVAEERLITARHPQYRAYAARTKRLIPYVI